MNNSFQVYLKEIPLTVPIVDYKRATLAYNMFYYMADRCSICTVDDYSMSMSTDDLVVIDRMGNVSKPELDPEWYGTQEQQDQIKNEASKNNKKLTKYSILYDRNNILSVCFNSARGIKSLSWFAPETYDCDKANELFNLAHYGIENSVSFSSPDGLGKLTDIYMSCTSLVNENGLIISEKRDVNWANNYVPDNERDFADAVANILVDNALEQ